MTDYNLVDELGDELDDELYTQGIYIGDPEFDNDLKNNYSVLGYQINKLKSRIRKMQTVLNEKEKLFEKIENILEREKERENAFKKLEKILEKPEAKKKKNDPYRGR